MLIWPCATDKTLCAAQTQIQSNNAIPCIHWACLNTHKHLAQFMFECVQMQDIGAVQYMIFRMYYMLMSIVMYILKAYFRKIHQVIPCKSIIRDNHIEKIMGKI